MRVPVVPAPGIFMAVATITVLALVSLIAGASVAVVGSLAASATTLVVLAALADWIATLRAWRASAPEMIRGLPAAFAIGVRREVPLVFTAGGSHRWHCQLFDGVDGALDPFGLPLSVVLEPGMRVQASYAVLPTRRGGVTFTPADVRVRSRWRTCELLVRLGRAETRRVYPDFAQVARYAWLAGDRRLQAIGIKTYQQRGEGTDFKQMSEYRPGDAVRHIDWRATLRLGKPIVRQFQDERDQRVLLLIDCGRRMRADDRSAAVGASHFDQVLNAVMLLTYVALREGDAVGAVTFGVSPANARAYAPEKGAHVLNALMAELHDVQPEPVFSDYVAAAQDLLRRHPRRALVVLITNFRDEDSAELRQALRLLRSRHLVLLASLRETVVDAMIDAPLTDDDAVVDVASAHLYEQSRRDAFTRLAARNGMMIDARPERLGIDLVNRYHAMKRGGLI